MKCIDTMRYDFTLKTPKISHGHSRHKVRILIPLRPFLRTDSDFLGKYKCVRFKKVSSLIICPYKNNFLFPLFFKTKIQKKYFFYFCQNCQKEISHWAKPCPKIYLYPIQINWFEMYRYNEVWFSLKNLKNKPRA